MLGNIAALEPHVASTEPDIIGWESLCSPQLCLPYPPGFKNPTSSALSGLGSTQSGSRSSSRSLTPSKFTLTEEIAAVWDVDSFDETKMISERMPAWISLASLKMFQTPLGKCPISLTTCLKEAEDFTGDVPRTLRVIAGSGADHQSNTPQFIDPSDETQRAVLCESALNLQQKIRQHSKGTEGHPHNCGAACKYVRRKGGCRNGADCTDCHLCRWVRNPAKNADPKLSKDTNDANVSKRRVDTNQLSAIEVPPPPSPFMDHISVGTMGHPYTCATACKYRRKASGCKDGKSCVRCHLCHWSRSVATENKVAGVKKTIEVGNIAGPREGDLTPIGENR